MVSIGAVSNPILQYKLDPGEWGSSSGATAANSISRVASHESSNLQRFENKAAKDGCYVVGKDLYLNLAQKGSYLSATSGHSQALTYCPKKEKSEQVKTALGSKIQSKIQQYSSDELKIKSIINSSKNSSLKDIFEDKLKKIESRKLQLQEKKMRLYTQVTLLLAQNIKFDPNTINISI